MTTDSGRILRIMNVDGRYDSYITRGTFTIVTVKDALYALMHPSRSIYLKKFVTPHLLQHIAVIEHDLGGPALPVYRDIGPADRDGAGTRYDRNRR